MGKTEKSIRRKAERENLHKPIPHKLPEYKKPRKIKDIMIKTKERYTEGNGEESDNQRFFKTEGFKRGKKVYIIVCKLP